MNDFYAYWNAEQMRDLFEAIVFIVGGNDFLGLLRSIAVAGALIVSTGAIMSRRHEAHFMFLLALAFFYMTLIVPKQSVTIRDVRAGTVYVVNNVPLGVGFFASTASHIGYWITNIFETAFIPANDVGKFSRFGLSFPQRALTALQHVGAVTPQGREMLNSLVRDCVVPEMLETPAKANEVIRSTNIWATITAAGWLNPARVTVGTDGSVQNCANMPAVVDTYLVNTEFPAMQELLGHKLVGDRPNPSAAIAAAMPQVEAVMMGMARTFEDSMRQSVMMDAIPNGIALAGASAEPLAVAVNMSAAQANVSSVINYRTMASMAKNFLPSMRNSIEFLVIAAFPLMMLMVLAAGHQAGTVLKGFFVMLIWVQLWAPLYAAINYLLVVVDANPLSQIQAAFGGNSLASVNLIREIGATSQDIAGMLTISVPIIAYALAKSSEVATTSMISTVFAPAQSAAQAMGSQLSQGNVNLGNLSWGNVNANNASANKSDMSTAWADPGMMRTTNGFGSVTSQAGVVAGVEASRFDVGVQGSARREETLANASFSGTSARSEWSTSAGLDLSKAAASTDSNVARAARLIAAGIVSDQGGERREQTGDSSRAGRSASEGVDLRTVAQNQQSASVDGRAGLGGALGLGGSRATGGGGGSGGGGGRVEANTGFGVRTAQQYVDMATGTAGATASTEQTKAAERVNAAVARVLASNEDRGVKEAALAFSAEFNRRVAASQSNQASVGGGASAGDEARRLSAGGANSSTDLGPMIASAIAARYGSAAAALRARATDPEGFERTAAAVAQRVAASSQAAQQDGLVTPTSQGAVLSAGGAAVSALSAQAEAQVAAARGADASAVKARQPASPMSAPDQSPARQAHAGAAAAAGGRLAQQQQWNDAQGGANVAAAALYRESQMGTGTLLSNAFLGAFRYKSAPEISEALQELASRDPALREMLAHTNKAGLDASTAAGKSRLEYFARQLESARLAKGASTAPRNELPMAP